MFNKPEIGMSKRIEVSQIVISGTLFSNKLSEISIQLLGEVVSSGKQLLV
jgi:hypothetical protein